MTATVRVTGLDGGEQLIVRLVTNLWCDPFETSVTGNIHANLDDANVVGGSKISVGAQTVPLKQAGNILFPGLNVLKTCPATGSVGGSITYQITVENTGEDTLNNIQVHDTILGDLSASFADTLAGGASETHSFQYTLTATPDPITNVVTATATAAQSSTELSDTADCTTDVLFPDLDITKTADHASVNAGEQVGYTITVTNNGEGKAFDVVMNDTLPTNPGLNWSVGADHRRLVLRDRDGCPDLRWQGVRPRGRCECIGPHHLAHHLGDLRDREQHGDRRRIERRAGVDRHRDHRGQMRCARHLEGGR